MAICRFSFGLDWVKDGRRHHSPQASEALEVFWCCHSLTVSTLNPSRFFKKMYISLEENCTNRRTFLLFGHSFGKIPTDHHFRIEGVHSIATLFRFVIKEKQFGLTFGLIEDCICMPHRLLSLISSLVSPVINRNEEYPDAGCSARLIRRVVGQQQHHVWECTLAIQITIAIPWQSAPERGK